ncbi:MAG: glycerophosphodiester phosphodiesterase [Desulfohalobiaceae bacterium]|nr:glycerophosphodiester phosphodiesterase [Desulfohalobiaceae bacterium]
MTSNIAHRGAGSLAPENTLAAAGKAYQTGADLWETDVRVSRDEALVLFHDLHPGRTTDAARVFPGRQKDRISDFSLAEIRRLDAGSYFEKNDPFGTIRSGEVTAKDLSAYQGQPVPTLEEGLRLTADLDWRINLELKSLPESMQDFPLVGRVLAEIEQAGLSPEKLVISSFSHNRLRQVQRLRPEIEVQALIGYSRIGPLDWGGYEFPVYNVRCTLISMDRIRRARERGMRINLFTVNDPKAMRRFIRAGVSGLITDYPQRLSRILQRNSSAKPV